MLRVAVLGCGRIATKHFQAIEALSEKGLTLDSVADSDAAVLGSVNLDKRVPRFASLERLLREREVDLLVIATPSGLHAANAMDAAGKVPAIVVEKPLALSLTDAEKMVDFCRKSGTRLFVVKQNRYNSAIQKVRASVRSGLLGEIHLGTVRVRWTRDSRYYNLADWRGTRTMDGSVIWNQASHHLDLLSLFLGPVQSVFAYGQTALASIEVEDTVVGIAKFAGGKVGVVEATTAARPSDLEGSLSLLGSRGAAIIGGFAVNKLEKLVFEGQDANEYPSRLRANEFPSDVYGYGHLKFYDDLADHLLRNGDFELTGENALETVRLIEMLDASVREGREIVRQAS